LLLRGSVFFAPFKWNPSGQGILSEWVYGWVGSQQLVSHVLAILLLLVQGFLVNVLTINHRLSNEITLFSGVFYVLVSCALPDFLYLSPVLIGNTFLLLALLDLFETYKNPACADKIFNAGFWIGLASLFYFPFLFFFIMLVAALNILRAFNVREQLMSLAGVLIPYLLVGLYFFWFNQFDVFLEKQFVRNMDFLDIGGLFSGGVQYLKLGIFVLLVIFALINNSFFLIKKNIQVQKKISILFWALAAAGVGLFFQKGLTFEHFLLFAAPMGIFLAFSFNQMKPHWAESIHLLMLVGVLALQFTSWLL
jgi:hypothetical protein